MPSGLPGAHRRAGIRAAIAEGDFARAYLIARGPNPFASICGRVCAAPCQRECRRGDIDEPVSIRALKWTATERHGPDGGGMSALDLTRYLSSRPLWDCEDLKELRPLLSALGGDSRPEPDGPKVAIIGSGPAGLACAHDLALLGCRPLVYERESVPAGMLHLGVPEYRLYHAT